MLVRHFGPDRRSLGGGAGALILAPGPDNRVMNEAQLLDHNWGQNEWITVW
jgi:hypothetical protein